jgi:hypothetical protein
MSFTATLSAQQKPRMVFLEVSADSRALVGTQQKWMEMLQGVGADRVVSKTAPTGTPKIQEDETTRSVIITVTGFIVGNKLKLPGGSFSIRDKTKIRELLTRLKDDGAKVAMAEKKAFGLTSQQLVGLHEKFSQPISFSTRDQLVGDVVSKILASQSGLKFVMDRTAKAALNGKETVAEELKGISTGTSLATILRPLGLVVQPRREQGKSLEIQLIDAKSSTEHWPIGWPIERSPISVEPKLFKKREIEVRDYPMAIAMKAVEDLTGVPFFYDHNTMAREGIDMNEVKVTFVQKKVSMVVAISKLLRQTKPRLSEEIRVDENGKAFLWITVK